MEEFTPEETKQILEMAQHGLGAQLDSLLGEELQLPEGTPPVTPEERQLAFDIIHILAPEGPDPYFAAFGIPQQFQGFLLERLAAAVDPIVVEIRTPEARTQAGERFLGVVAACGRHWGWNAQAVADVLAASGPWDEAPEEDREPEDLDVEDQAPFEEPELPTEGPLWEGPLDDSDPSLEPWPEGASHPDLSPGE